MSKSTIKLKKKWNTSDIGDQTGKIAVVTGGNSGLGYVSSRELAINGAHVIMAVRNTDKGEQGKKEINTQYPDAKIDVMEMDLSRLASINNFADKFNNEYGKLDILMNNAGVMQPPYMETEDGFELQMGVNHMGHYTITGLLLEALKSTPSSRVVNVSSMMHRRGKMNFDDLMSKESYSKTGAYSQSKLANLLFTYELDRKFKKHNIDTISVATHPGYSRTNLQQGGPTLGGKSIWYRLYKISNLFAQSVEKGTLSQLCAAVSPEVMGGDFIGSKEFMETRGYPTRYRSSSRSYNEEDARTLWKMSENMTGIIYKF